MTSATIKLAMELVSRRSVTPNDEGCQKVLAQRLAKLGFECEHMRYGRVDNLWAKRGHNAPLLVFAGHTDVVASGPIDKWDTDPFIPELKDGYLFGRGTADMKGSLAAMVTACERFISSNLGHAGSIAFLITSDEEGVAVDGTKKVVKTLNERDEKIDWCLVGEPSSRERLGDVIKNGRRGSRTGELIIHGTQGHVAYPDMAQNPIHSIALLLNELTEMTWDNGNEFFPPTTFQISNIHSGTGSENVIPGEVEALFNFRFSTEQTPETLKTQVMRILDSHNLNFLLNWRLSGNPFLTPSGELLDAVKECIREELSIETEVSTTGGTSDGRFIAPSGAQVIELGPVNKTIHKVNECTSTSELNSLSSVYENILNRLMGS